MRTYVILSIWFRFIEIRKIGTFGDTKSTIRCTHSKPEGSIKTIEFGASMQTIQ